MRKVLLIVATAIFLYSPYGPSWGRTAVNAVILLAFANSCFRSMPKRRYYDEEEEYN
jgi:hypothetical protein